MEVAHNSVPVLKETAILLHSAAHHHHRVAVIRQAGQVVVPVVLHTPEVVLLLQAVAPAVAAL